MTYILLTSLAISLGVLACYIHEVSILRRDIRLLRLDNSCMRAEIAWRNIEASRNSVDLGSNLP